MIVEFRVKNFRSFREEQTLSLVASRDGTLPDNCVSKGRLRFLKAAAVYGANASGKSNLIRAVATMKGIVLDSAEYKPGQKLEVMPFLLDAESGKEPSVFEMVFYVEGVRYQYGFAATSKRIEEEWLAAYPKGSAQNWFERKFNEKRHEYDWKYSTFFRGNKVALAEKTRENALFLSVGAQWNNEQLRVVYEWFRTKLQVLSSRRMLHPVTAKMLLPPERPAGTEGNLRHTITRILQEADLGINNVAVRKKEIDMDVMTWPTDLPDEVRSKLTRLIEEEEGIEVDVLHENAETGKEVHIPLNEESDGTQVFFKLIGPWLYALRFGITILIDEIESSLHPLLTRQLVHIIQGLRIDNKEGAQLIFATHDTTLLDPELLRRDQIWFTEKDKNGGTRLCPLSDYRPRKGEAIQKGYLSGRYGGVPILERFSIE